MTRAVLRGYPLQMGSCRAPEDTELAHLNKLRQTSISRGFLREASEARLLSLSRGCFVSVLAQLGL